MRSLIAFCCLVALSLGSAGAAERPNVLFILVDDLGWADIGCYGADLHETPHIDKLAGEGTRFTQAYAASPVCSPTRASILTGKSPARLHMTIWLEGAKSAPNLKRPWIEAKPRHNLPHEEFTIAEALHDAGYQTWHVGKWHLGEAGFYPETQGFDLNIGGTFWGAPATFYHPFSGLFGNIKEQRYVPGLGVGNKDDYLTDRLTDEAIKLIENQGEKPFFLNLCYHTVHTPIEGKPEDVEYFRQKLTPEMHHQNSEYAAMVRHLDNNVGRLMQTLEETGKAKDTLVIFFSDNGGFVNNFKGKQVTNNHQLRSGKGSAYEGGVREPLIVRFPGITKAGAVCETPVISMDFYPTILELTGAVGNAHQNERLEGFSLVPLLKDPKAKFRRRELHWHYPHYYPTTTPVSAIRDGDWKLVHYYDGDRDELYNLAEDLGEATDLAKGNRSKAKELRAKLDEWLYQVDAQLPVKNPNHKGR